MPPSRLGIVGLGLMGGSIALGARHVWPDLQVVGIDREDGAERALRRGIVQQASTDISSLAGADLIVLAVPVRQIVELLPAIAALGGTATVTDVGSTKRQVVAASGRWSWFVGGHPMAGSEQGGLDHARADLFAGRPWLLVRGGATDEAAASVEDFVAALGARPRWMAADEHDRTVAYISHLPQVLAVALMNAAAEAIGDDGLAASGRAFGEMTRLAASPPDLWEGILTDNADFVREALLRFTRELPPGDPLEGGWIREAFARAAAARDRTRGD